MNFDQRTLPTILCCMCGVPIPSNPSNMCVNCVRNVVDITEGIPKQLTMQMCSNCGRYLNPPNQWLVAELESKELLAMCLKRVRGLNKVKLVDAGFIWTEPHSRRIKVKLTIQKEVFTSTILQQAFIVEYVVQTQQCEACQKFWAKDTWNAVCQVRQKVSHKRTFYWLEQLILKYGAHMNTINVKQCPDGLDFFYANKSQALKFIDFLNAVVPIRYKSSERLISHDEHSNTYNYKYTYSIELVPVCRDDVVCLPTRLATTSGNISPLVLCYKVASILHVIDPLTLQTTEITAATFWNQPFRAIANSRNLIEYVVIDIQPLGPTNGKFVLAEVHVARASDFGNNDTIFIGKTHLGYLLRPGDYALGYDLSTTIYNDADMKSFKGHLPDFVLVKKSYAEKKKRRGKNRIWKLKTLEKEVDDDKKVDPEKEAEDMEDFLQELEEDPELRANVNLYRVKNAEKILADQRRAAEDEMEDDTEAGPDVGLEELIDDLHLTDHE